MPKASTASATSLLYSSQRERAGHAKQAFWQAFPSFFTRAVYRYARTGDVFFNRQMGEEEGMPVAASRGKAL
jgi:hypothetical protein